MKSSFIFILLALLSIDIKAQNDSISDDEYPFVLQQITSLADWGVDLLTFEKENSTFFVFPLIGYEERTGLEYGIMPVWRFYIGGKKDGGDYFRPSNISPYLMAATKGMYVFNLSSDFYTKNNWYIKNKWVFRSMPDKFYIIGNIGDKDSYSSFDIRKYEFTGKVMKGITNELFVGVNYDVGFYNVNNINGDVLNYDVVGVGKSGFVGVGSVANYDDRNSVVYPLSGSFAEISYTKFIEPIGDFDFSSLTIDYRKYFDLGKNEQVVAFQSYLHSIYGNAPFYRFAGLGGNDLFRGISSPYKYMDKNSVYFQVAYRSHLWWRFGYEVFSGVGNVFKKWNSLAVKDVHVMGGMGLRLRVLENEKLSFRLDLGLTNRGDHGIFFTLGEAF